MQEGASRARLSVENGLEQAEVTRGAEQAKVTRGSGREAKRARLSGGEMDMAGDDGKQQSHLVLAPKLFLLSHPDVDDLAKVDLRADVLAAVKSDDMAALYELLTADGVEMHAALLAEMHARIDEEIRKLDEKILKADAEENLGDSEVHEAHLAKSLYFIRVGEKAQDNYFGTSSVPICIFKLGCPGTKR